MVWSNYLTNILRRLWLILGTFFTRWLRVSSGNLATTLHWRENFKTFINWDITQVSRTVSAMWLDVFTLYLWVLIIRDGSIIALLICPRQLLRHENLICVFCFLAIDKIYELWICVYNDWSTLSHVYWSSQLVNFHTNYELWITQQQLNFYF